MNSCGTRGKCICVSHLVKKEPSIPGPPFSGMWLSTSPKSGETYCDGNFTGIAVVLIILEAEEGAPAVCGREAL